MWKANQSKWRKSDQSYWISNENENSAEIISKIYNVVSQPVKVMK